MTNLYIDAEWHTHSKLYLLGYAYNLRSFHYATYVTYNVVMDIIAPVDGIVYCYGPDIGIIHNKIGINIKKYRPVVNLLKVVRLLLPHLPNYKLSTVEYHLGLKRTTATYKTNHQDISRHFYSPQHRQAVIRYNREDVLNLIRIRRKLNLSYEQWLKWSLH